MNFNLLLISLAFLVSSCGLTQRAGFIDLSNLKTGVSLAPSTSTTSAFANSLILPSGMSRHSGVEFINKVIYLFPKVDLGISNAPNGTALDLSNKNVQISLRSIGTQDGLNPEELPLSFVRPFIPAKVTNSIQALANNDRSTGPLVMLQAREIFNLLCAKENITTDKSTLFLSNSDILMSGEHFPKDESLKIAFTVARRAWNFPYLADSEEVLVLKKLYDDSNTPDPDDKKANLCKAALLSVQFWEGNPGKIDVLNRVGLAIVGRRPSFEQFDRYANKGLTLKEFTKGLQTNSDTSEDYLSNVVRWHAIRLGLRKFNFLHILDTLVSKTKDITQLSNIMVAYYQSNFGKSTGGNKNGVPIVSTDMNLTRSFDGCPYASTFDSDWKTSKTGMSSSKPVNTNQAFDPRTTGLFWEQYNPVTSTYEVIAGWVLRPFINQWRDALKDNDISKTSDADYISANCEVDKIDSRWLQCKGFFTKNGIKNLISLKDIKSSNSGNSSLSPVDDIAGEDHPGISSNYYSGALMRRVVRYSPATAENPSGRNDGYSRIKGFFTNKDVLACNSIMRFIASCAYTPPVDSSNRLSLERNSDCPWGNSECSVRSDEDPDDLIKRPIIGGDGKPIKDQSGNLITSDTVKGYVQRWNATRALPNRRGYTDNANVLVLQGFEHPAVLNSFRCGIPNSNAMSAGLDTAYPYGYDPLLEGTDQVPKSWLSKPGELAESISANNIRYVGNQMVDTLANDGQEDFLRIQNEILDEPYRLIKAVVSGRDYGTQAYDSTLNYGQLVNADFSYITKELELFYRTRGETLSIRPDNFSYEGLSNESIQKVRFKGSSSKFINFPKKYIKTDYSGESFSSDRPAAGILQMPGLLNAMAPGSPRSISSRVFARLLCGEANLYDPKDDGKYDDHLESFHQIATNGIQGYTSGSYSVEDHDKMTAFIKDHANQASCMSCHLNLDPLGMALFKFYGNNLAQKHKLGQNFGAYEPEISSPTTQSMYPFGSAVDDTRIGEGMLLGKNAKGFEGVGKVLSESRLYYSCATQDAFQNMFGRLPSSIEARRAYKNVVDKFMSTKNYNEMIQGLAEIQENLGGE